MSELAIFKGLAAAQVVEATGCESDEALSAVDRALRPVYRDIPTPESVCRVVLDAVEIVRQT